MNYRIMLLGFMLLTLGIASGVAWLNQSERDLGIDLMQVLSGILWLLYAANLHLRYARGWQGSRTAAFSIFNFLLVVIFFIAGGFAGNTFHQFGGE
jgi:ABC-type transport system involved in cytochrome c biogenesis permease subunit